MSGSVGTGSADSYTWIGATGALWASASNWADTTTGKNPAASAPGSLTPVTLANTASTAYKLVEGGGTAASIGILGNFDLLGAYVIGGTVTIGSLTPASTPTLTAGSLVLSSGGTISAGALNLLDGALALSATTKTTVTGSALVGFAGGYEVANNGTFAATAGASSTLSLASGATLSVGGSLTIGMGSLNDTGGKVSVGGAVTIGTAATVIASAPLQSFNASYGRIAAIAGGTFAAAGSVSAPDAMVVADGAGSVFSANGTLTTGAGSTYTSSGTTTAGTTPGAVVAVNGGFVQVGGLVLAPPSSAVVADTVISVDSASTIEVGLAGGAAAGAITIDAGRTAAASATSAFNGALVDNGILIINAGTLTQNGKVSGSGTVEIGHNAAWVLNGTVAATDTISFLGTSAVLSIGSAGTVPYAVGATVTGFEISDTIALSGSLTAASYTAGTGANPGTLTLSNNSTTVETLHLTGTFTGDVFAVSQANSGAMVTLVASSPGGSPQSTNADTYTWVGATGASWGTAVDWRDVTAGNVVTAYAPGALTPVIISNAPGAPLETILGGGKAASATLTGNIAFGGAYTIGGTVTIGTLAVGSAVALTSGSLTVSAAATIAAGALNVLDGTLSFGSNAVVTTTGGVSVGLAPGYDIPNNGTYAYTSGASSTVSLATGNTLTVAGNLLLNAGTVTDAGGRVAVGGNLTVGTAGSTLSTTPLQTVGTAAASIAVTAAGTVTVAGNVSAPEGIVIADGAGSSLVASGTLTTGVGGTYSYQVDGFPDAFDGVLIALRGATIRLGGLVLDSPSSTPSVYTVIYADGSSSIEVGSTGGASTGAITIDAGRTVTAVTMAGLYGNLIDNGTLMVAGGTLTQSGQVSGNGVIAIGRDATFLLAGAISNTDTISFLDTGATLLIGGEFSYISTTFSSYSYDLNALVTGFQAGDAIDMFDPVTAAAYAAGVGVNPGTLTLSNNGTVVEIIKLTGNFAGYTFTVSPTTSGGAVISLVSQSPASSSAAAPNSDTYAWIGPSGGSWGSAANWADTSAAISPASYRPGTLTAVTLTGPASTSEVITGGGTAASVAVAGSIDLLGRYLVGGTLAVGTLTPGTTIAAAAPGSLELLSGGTITGGQINVLDGTLLLDGGTTITTSGSVAIGIAAGKDVPNNGTYVSTTGAAGTVNIETGATLHATGALTVNMGSLTDAGGLVTLGGTLTVGTAANGTTLATYYTTAAPGVVAVTSGGSLTVTGGISEPDGIVVADGIGSTLIAGGTFAAGGSGSYTDASPLALSTCTASLAALNSGFVRVGNVVLTGSAASTGLLVDGASTIEVGTAGGASGGAITVDPGYSITSSATASLTGNLVDNGTLIVAGGTLVQAGSVTGTGTIQIGSNATWVLNGGIAATDTISFLSAGAVLAVGNYTSVPGLPSTLDAVGATLSNFQAGDSLVVAEPVTAVSYRAGTGANPGTLVLTNGTSLVATLSLAGSYTGRTFAVTPSTSGATISLLNNLAVPGVLSLGGASLTQAGTIWTLNLGMALQGGASLTDTLGIANLATGTVGALGGTFSISNASGFINAGFATGFTGIAGGQNEHQQTITLSTGTAGTFTETIVVSPTSMSSASTLGLQSQTIAVTGTVLPVGTTYALTAAPTTITAGANSDTFNVPSGALNSHDSLNGGGGVNFLNLIGGGGIFDLGAPAVLTNLQIVNATEGSSPTTIYMRNGYSATVDLAPAPGGGGSALIYGGTGNDVFNLSTGADTVVLGSATEVVNAGGGTAVVQAAIGFAGAVVTGTTTGSTTLDITTGGTATLAADSYLTVSLVAATHLSLGTAQFVTAIGSGGGDTILAGAAWQTLTGGGGADTLVGFTGFGDGFVDTSSGINGDTIVNFGGNDTIDITDLSFGTLRTPVVSVAGSGAGAVSTLVLSNGTHNATVTLQGSYATGNFAFGSDGHTGLLIGFV